MTEFFHRALTAKRESKHCDFKGACDLAFPGTWCEIVKDIVAMANSGGGVIVIGLDNSGHPTGADVSAVLALDQAVIADQIHKYTGVHFANVEVVGKSKGGHSLAVITVSPVSVPIVFTKPGTYKVDEKNQKTAFSAGTVYFRHGAKSEPGDTEDLRSSVERQIDSIRKSWLKGVRKVVQAPPGSRVLTFPATVEIQESSSPDATAIRIVDDPTAPAYRKLDYDITHPYRQKDVIKKANEALTGKISINQHDIRCVRHLYPIEKDESLYHWNTFANTPQYSAKFVAWLVAQFEKDEQFFQKIRAKVHEKRK
jgi:hypothetical protein